MKIPVILQVRVFLVTDSSVSVPGAASALRFNPNATFSRLGACTPETDMVA
jgi:hypothetical protein